MAQGAVRTARSVRWVAIVLSVFLTASCQSSVGSQRELPAVQSAPGGQSVPGGAVDEPRSASSSLATSAGQAPGGEESTLPLCPSVLPAQSLLPTVTEEHLTLEYWLAHWGQQFDLDEQLLSPEQIDALNASIAVPRPKYAPRRDLTAKVDRTVLIREVNDRRVWALESLVPRGPEQAKYVQRDGSNVPEEQLGVLSEEVPLLETRAKLHLAVSDAQIHCAPLNLAFYSPLLDLRLNRNACSTLRAQELVRVLGVWPNGMRLVQAEYSFGWLAPDAELSPELPRRVGVAAARPDKLQVVAPLVVTGEEKAKETSLAVGTLLTPVAGRSKRGYVGTGSGVAETAKAQSQSLLSTRRGLTRRVFLQQLWRHLGTPYGLGGTNGGRDCSRLVMDTLGAVSIQLPRHSSWQALAGSYSINTEGASEEQTQAVLDEAAKQGIVLLYFPGHIMVYLGRDADSVPRVFHAFGEYLEPCEGSVSSARRETLRQVENVTVSGLQLGRNTSRRAFVERITRVTVFGPPPSEQLAGVAQLRRAVPLPDKLSRRCRDSRRSALYAFPEKPNTQQPLTVAAVMDEHPGAAGFTLIDPDGRRTMPESVHLGGPPFGQVVSVAAPQAGVWRAVFADGADVVACQSIRVAGERPEPLPAADGSIWDPRWKWSVASENLYSLFVERLVDYPPSDDRVWPNLHSLLRDPLRNILYDYRGLAEDELLELQPDCADLPYTLRAYFAWKMRLPFGYRRCSRARDGKPPNCDQPDVGDNLFSNLMNRLELKGEGGQQQVHDDVEAFALFVNRHMRFKVHSSSGRTLPNDEKTDFYPVALNRRSLKPGTLFADPYGHLLVVADFQPQSARAPGLLIAVDAQPDGTIGRRRFWRGSFLFHPETTGGGAGFKAFRPRRFVEEPVEVDLQTGSRVVPPPVVDAGAPEPLEVSDSDDPAAPQGPAGQLSPEPGSLVPRIGYLEDVDNESLQGTRVFTPLSFEQYERSRDAFYDQVEAVINPHPLDPAVVQRQLVDALAESVARRVVSVNNAERWHAEHPDQIVPMPEGAGIFLASGPWENFSTPSRDLRLLISIDSVLQFEEQVRRAPARFGIEPGQVEDEAARLTQVLREALGAESFEYRRSDGQVQRLSLQQLVDRSEALEMAYNPNDCAEVRWGAAPQSAEWTSCGRTAPEPQRQSMLQYRHWFSTRSRPAR